MLYKFKSKATGDLIMLEPNGRRMLQIIGKEVHEGAPVKGILLPEQMPAAIAALQAAIAQEEQVQQSDAVSLRQRAKPFIDMLNRCHTANKEIVWGV
jgi:hypothetical protein